VSEINWDETGMVIDCWFRLNTYSELYGESNSHVNDDVT